MIDCFLVFSLLSQQYYEEPKLYTRVLDGFNIGFTAVFLLESILKLIAFKPKVRVIDMQSRDGFNLCSTYEG